MVEERILSSLLVFRRMKDGIIADEFWRLRQRGGDLVSIIRRTLDSLPGIGHASKCSSIH